MKEMRGGLLCELLTSQAQQKISTVQYRIRAEIAKTLKAFLLLDPETLGFAKSSDLAGSIRNQAIALRGAHAPQ